MKKNFSTIVSVITCALLVFCIWQNHNLQKEVDWLYAQLDYKYDRLSEQIDLSEGYLKKQIEEQSEKQNSLFHKIETDVAYYDNKIALTITAIPKELKTGETLWVSVEVNGKTLQQKFDNENRAILYFDPVYAVTPVIQVKSSNNVKQQVLDEIKVVNNMSTRILGEWNENIPSGDIELSIADITIEPSQSFNRDTGLIPFTAEDIVDAYALVEISDEWWKATAEGHIEWPAFMPNGERLDVELVTANGAKEIVYRADLSKYKAAAEDVQYVMHFVVELSNGLIYCTEDNHILEFNYGDKSRGFGGSSSDFVPILEWNK